MKIPVQKRALLWVRDAHRHPNLLVLGEGVGRSLSTGDPVLTPEGGGGTNRKSPLWIGLHIGVQEVGRCLCGPLTYLQLSFLPQPV